MYIADELTYFTDYDVISGFIQNTCHQQFPKIRYELMLIYYESDMVTLCPRKMSNLRVVNLTYWGTNFHCFNYFVYMYLHIS